MTVQYFNGSKQFYANSKVVGALIKKQRQEGYKLNRKEYILVKTTEADARRMIPFFTVLLLAPETLPFFLIYSPGFVPSTCISHEQTEKVWESLHKKRIEISKNIVAELLKTIANGDRGT
ncbi:hypothetical protein HDU76_005880, partial [Blyttiomyces sp. JEL0837]